MMIAAAELSPVENILVRWASFLVKPGSKLVPIIDEECRRINHRGAGGFSRARGYQRYESMETEMERMPEFMKDRFKGLAWWTLLSGLWCYSVAVASAGGGAVLV